MSGADLGGVLWISLRVAVVATLVDLAPAVGLGYLLARRRISFAPLIHAIVNLPLVLPPVAVGYVLLSLLSRRGAIGGLLEAAGFPVVFTWRAAAIASAVMAFPLLVRTAEQAFAEVPSRIEQVARSLGAGPWRTFFRVSLPLGRRGVAYGALLAYLRALGEFGATALVAGNIPGVTQTLALGIYDAVQTSRDRDALVLSGLSIGLSLLAVVLGELFLRREGRR